MLAIIQFGTIGFWVFLALAVIAIMICLQYAHEDKDSGGGFGATVVTLISVALYWWLGDDQDIRSFFTFIKTSLLTFLGYLLVYYVIGVVWSVIKWYFYLQSHKEKLEKKIAKDGEEYTLRHHDFPTAKESKNKIVTWMSYWPFSILWTVLHDSIMKAYNFIYSKLSGIYTSLEERALGDLKKQKEEVRQKDNKR